MLYASAVAPSTNDKAAAATHHDNGDIKCTPRRRSLRRKIPYVESFEEQIARNLWEKDPFRGVEHVVDTIIIGSGSDNGDTNNCDRNTTIKFQVTSILTPIKSAISKYLHCHDGNQRPSPMVPSLSGYEDSFDLLYNRTKGDDVDPESDNNVAGTNIIGTASVAASPFAVIADNNETKREKLNHFCLRVAYKGDDFCGWQTQLNNFEKPSVQRTLEEWLTELQNDQPLDAEKNAEMKRTRRLKKRSAGDDSKNANTPNSNNRSSNNRSSKLRKKIKWADLPVAGRTDSGVSAIGQLCRFRTYRKDLTTEWIKTYLNNEKALNHPRISQSLRVTDITRVSKAFHPTFTTSCRAYAYVIDIHSSSSSSKAHQPPIPGGEFAFDLLGEEGAERQVALLDGMLRTLEGKCLDYIGLSYGKVKTTNTLCTLYHARARLVEYEKLSAPASAAGEQVITSAKAVCIELVGDRFLRRMVRLLVEASVRLVATADIHSDIDDNGNGNDNWNDNGNGNGNENNGRGGEAAERARIKDEDNDALLSLRKLIEKQDRSLVGRPAPPDGLLFVGARVQSD